MGELLKLPNVGKVLEKHLLHVGIETPEQLRQLGSKEVFILIREQEDPTACLHMLYGIEGAIEDIPDKFLNSETKRELKVFFESL